VGHRDKQSTRSVLGRCLALLHRLQRGPAGKRELIRVVLDTVGRDAYGRSAGRALDKRFEADKRRLRNLFGVVLRYHRSAAEYEIAELETALLDLPDEGLSTIAFLQETFRPGTPRHDEVQNLLTLLLGYLSPDRRQELQRQRTALQIEWGQRDDDVITLQVEDGLTRALIQRRLVEFDYHSPAQQDRQPRRHTVEPRERYFDSVRGHYYLRGYCRYTVGPPGRREQNRYFQYRLGRIRNLKVRAAKLPPMPRRAAKVEVVYRLAPDIARRREVTRHPGIEILQTEQQPDGGVLVRAETAEVWWAVRTLLHYGANCQVVGGAEALLEMRRVVEEMGQVYGFRREE